MHATCLHPHVLVYEHVNQVMHMHVHVHVVHVVVSPFFFGSHFLSWAYIYSFVVSSVV